MPLSLRFWLISLICEIYHLNGLQLKRKARKLMGASHKLFELGESPETAKHLDVS